MKIFNVAQIHAWDQYTMANEPITSIDLMERACQSFVHRFVKIYANDQPIFIFCGLGNNGGDGLAISRLLSQLGYKVYPYVITYSDKKANNFRINYQRLKEYIIPTEIREDEDFPVIPNDSIIIDAIFGFGLNRPLTGLLAKVVAYMNQSPAERVAVDMPSGLYADRPSDSKVIFQAHYTITFQVPKLAFMIPENDIYVGKWELADINLRPDYYNTTQTPYHFLDVDLAKKIRRNRAKFSHKGTYGHALLLLGSHGKMGASVLATQACLKSGVGLTTAHVPNCGYEIMQTAVPEAMISVDPEEDYLSQFPDISEDKYDGIGLGCGLGQNEATRFMLKQLLEQVKKPMVFDADAINILANFSEDLQEQIPLGSILTPHPKEFSRLVGATQNHFERLDVLSHFAQVYKVVVVLKGAHTAVATPLGEVYFNATGNPGMATGGTGDVLTGIITGLLAQGYIPQEAALLGVYLHGKAGDLALEEESEESMIAGKLVNFLGRAYKSLE